MDKKPALSDQLCEKSLRSILYAVIAMGALFILSPFLPTEDAVFLSHWHLRAIMFLLCALAALVGILFVKSIYHLFKYHREVGKHPEK